MARAGEEQPGAVYRQILFDIFWCVLVPGAKIASVQICRNASIRRDVSCGGCSGGQPVQPGLRLLFVFRSSCIFPCVRGFAAEDLGIQQFRRIILSTVGYP